MNATTSTDAPPPATRAAAAPAMADPATERRLAPSDDFAPRHIGPHDDDVAAMLRTLGADDLDAFIDATIPAEIRHAGLLDLPTARGEHAALEDLRAIAGRNVVRRTCLGMGYADCVVPPVIQRNVLENPGWYTQYTPYQAEIAQGRLEALLNFQTMVSDLTGMELANASLLDEGTAAAEAMSMCAAIAAPSAEHPVFVVAEDCHPQTIAVVEARARARGIELRVGDPATIELPADRFCGALLQYPTTDGRIAAYDDVAERIHAAGGQVVVAADPLALVLLRPPAAFGADIVVGCTQRFGTPLGAGGPHAGYLATREQHARKMPGRVVGISRDAQGRPAYRLAIQTREQHIKRDRATSNICTAQVLPAILASMYAVYHGPKGLRRIARRVRGLTLALREGLDRLGFGTGDDPVFDTIRVRGDRGALEAAFTESAARGFDLRRFDDGTLGIALDETTSVEEVTALLASFAGDRPVPDLVESLAEAVDPGLPAPHGRAGAILEHPVFNEHHSETEMLRYLAGLQRRDLSLADSMIPLGSCTMKLNATAEMMPITWPAFGRIHPFAAAEHVRGYTELFRQLESWLAEITGFDAVSLQPNAGSQGEFAGLLVIRAWHADRGEPQRDVCLIPASAHGTNPASAVVAGLRVVPVQCDEKGNIDVDDLRAKAGEHADRLAALMVTYPSTHGVFERSIREVCAIVHEHGGQVYLDGANLNAQVGLVRPGDIGADVCHLNLHKTFCIPHGGGGPGMGPIAVAAHLAPYLPGHPVAPPDVSGPKSIGAIASAPYGSPSILPISWMYIAMMGPRGLARASKVAILNANYMAERLRGHYDVLYTGPAGRVAHEFIIDCRPFDRSAGVRIDDIAKRLMDYGFHAPTMAWPVPGTLMIEPTESEPRAELDRFCDALIAIRQEIRDIEEGRADREDNLLKNAPHTVESVTADRWDHPYPRQQAVFPLPWLRERKFWPPVGRIDNPYGDRHLVCTCQ